MASPCDVCTLRRSPPLPEGFERWAATFDLFNLVGLLCAPLELA
ncbi:hypothetical protein WME90_01340 [Sorangium sp. So ce375]